GPGVQLRLSARLALATGGRVDRRRVGGHRRVRLSEEGQQLRVQVEPAYGHQIDQGDADVVPQQAGTFRDEQLATLRTVLVCRANDLHGRHQPTVARLIKDQDFVNILIREIDVDGERGCGRRQGGRGRAAIGHRMRIRVPTPVAILVERAYVDLEVGA